MRCQCAFLSLFAQGRAQVETGGPALLLEVRGPWKYAVCPPVLPLLAILPWLGDSMCQKGPSEPMHFILPQSLSILRAAEATVLALLWGVGMGDLACGG